MAAEVIELIRMNKLAIFSLPAVVRFDQDLIVTYLIKSICDEEDCSIKKRDIPEFENATEFVQDVYQNILDKSVSPKKLNRISKSFTKKIKKYFVEEDESFEIRPGVQSIFNHIEKKRKWKYCIVSNLWAEATHLILQSCGVFSKGKFTITADEAVSFEDQLKLAYKRAKVEDTGLQLFYLNGNDSKKQSNKFTLVQHKFSKSKNNYFAYPKFSELFPKQKK